MYLNWRLTFRWGFAFVLIVVGFILNNVYGYSVGLPFGSVGNYLLFIGLIMVVMNVFQTLFSKKQIKHDERTNYIGFKASRITYLILIIGLFTTMIIGMITQVQVSLYLFSSYVICAFVFVYFIAYKVLEKYN